jgi:hypothetical protein
MKKLAFFLVALFCHSIVKSQEKDIHVSLEAQGIATSSGVVPFWLRANQFGSIPLSGGSGSFIGKIRKDYDTTKTFGWAASFEGRTNLGKQAQFDLIEGFVKGHAGIFELKVGRSKDIIGLVDSTLSSGAFSVSGNALGIPKISISIPNYYSIPILGKLFAVKASFANGYQGNIAVHYNYRKVDSTKSYYLENTLYARIGKPQWRFKLYLGYNHEVLWGAEKSIFGSYKLSGSDTYWHVLLGKTYHGSKVGNHLGSLDIGAEYKFDALTLFLYRQNFYDKGGLGSLANIADGLNGLSLTNNKPAGGNFYVKKVLFEFLYTVNQGGYPSSKFTWSGAEDYYNNYEYEQGWSYKNLAMGTPFLTTVIDARSGLASSDRQFFINNRVLALHAAAEVYAYKWFYTGKISYSVNHGTYATGSGPFRSVGRDLVLPSVYPPFKKVNQLSLYLEGIRPLKNNYSIGYDIGYDRGGLLYNSFGVILKVSKSFL